MKRNFRLFYFVLTLFLALVLTSCSSTSKPKVKYEVEDGYLVCYVDNVKQVNTTYEDNTFNSNGYCTKQGFVRAKQDVYYVKADYTVALEYQIIEEKLYYFGLNGRMLMNDSFNDVYFGTDGSAYSEVSITIFINHIEYMLDGNHIYEYKEDLGFTIQDGYLVYLDGFNRKLTNTTRDGITFNENGYATNQGFVQIGEVTYYITIDLKIAISYTIINNYIYNFGEDGKMITGTHTDGYTYDAEGKLTGTNIFITIELNTYYIIDCTIVVGYQVINNNIYNFGEDGKMITGTHTDGYTYGTDGKLTGTNIFVTIDIHVYYIIDCTIALGYQIIEDKLYNFGEDGKMITGTHTDGYTYNEQGYVEAVYLQVTIEGTVYVIVNNNIYVTTSFTGTVVESDHTMDTEDNETVDSVTVNLIVNGYVFTSVTTTDGTYVFDNVPATEAVIQFERTGYITIEMNINITVVEINHIVIIDKEVSNTLTGKVVIADADTNNTNNASLAGALVEATRVSSTNNWHYTTYTDANGNYTFNNITAGVYEIVIYMEGYIEITQTVNVRVNQTVVQNQPIEAIPSSNTSTGHASGQLIDSRTGRTLSNITIYIRAGINNVTGEVLLKLVTDSSGYYTINNLLAGNYTAQIVDERILSDEDERYGTITIAIKVLSDKTISNQNATISNSVGLSIDGLRIVLTWGSTPSDLDSYLHVDRTSLSDYTVYYSSKNPVPNASLDVDDTSSYGPETVTVSSIDDGIYHYVVHDYTNRSYSSSTSLANSGATVTVYFGSSPVPAYTFYVPSGAGTCWHVFTYNSVTEEFTINNIINNSNSFLG